MESKINVRADYTQLWTSQTHGGDWTEFNAAYVSITK